MPVALFDPDKDVYLPGVFKCDKCGFVLQKINLNMGDGTVSAGTTTELCPNDDMIMFRRKYRDAYEELYEAYEKLILGV